MTTLAGFVLVAGLLVISPGPNGVLIAKTVPTGGRAAGFANILGFVLAFQLHGALSILGISLILVQSATAFTIVKLLGAAYLCWIGVRALWSAWKAGASAVPPVAGSAREGEAGGGEGAVRPPGFRLRSLFMAVGEGFLTNALNPKVSMFYLAAFPQFLSRTDHSAWSSFALVQVHASINVLWFTAMVVLFERLADGARNPRFQRWVKGVTGAVFLGFGVKLATLRP